MYVHDELAGKEFADADSFPVAPIVLSARTCSARTREFDERIAARPELFPGFAAVWDGAAA